MAEKAEKETAVEDRGDGASRGATAERGDVRNADVAELSFEEARAELIEIVATLEQGGGTLEESIAAWERGEAMATRCQAWLDGARVRLQVAQRQGSVPAPETGE